MINAEINRMMKLKNNAFREEIGAIGKADLLDLKAALYCEIQSIEMQLENPVHKGYDGLPLGPEDYASWKVKATHALRWSKSKYQTAKAHLDGFDERAKAPAALAPIVGQVGLMGMVESLHGIIASLDNYEPLELTAEERKTLDAAGKIIDHQRRKAVPA